MNILYSVELTDTFGGEANYSWVRRHTFSAPDNASDAVLIRRAKKALDITGRHVKESWNSDITLRFPRACIIVFITVAEF